MNVHPVLKKRPHLGEQRSKVIVNVRVNFLRFLINDFYLKNSYYCVYFEGQKRNKVKTQTLTKSLESLTVEEGLRIDDSIKCSVTMYQDELHRKYMNGRLKAKFKRIVIRQMTKLRSGEILYRDVGYVSLPLHRIIQEPDLFDTRLVMTHPANAIDAYVDVTIDAKVEGFMSSMPTSLDTPRSVLKSVQSGFNLLGLGTPIIKNRFISIESQYFGPSPAKPTFIDLHALSESGKINNFSLEDIPVDQITPMSESNKSFFFSFWSKKQRPYNSKEDCNDGVVTIEEPKRTVHFKGSTKQTEPTRSNSISNRSLSSSIDGTDYKAGLSLRVEEIYVNGSKDSFDDPVPSSAGRTPALKRKGTGVSLGAFRRNFSTELDDDDDDNSSTSNNNNHEADKDLASENDDNEESFVPALETKEEVKATEEDEEEPGDDEKSSFELERLHRVPMEALRSVDNTASDTPEKTE